MSDSGRACEPARAASSILVLIVRGAIDRLEFIAFRLHEQRVLAGMNVKTWNVTDQINQLISDRTLIDPEQLADPAVPLTELTTPT